MLVVPHGVDTKMFNADIPPYKLKTEKRVKFLHNAIPHHRKLHERVLRGYLDTFTGDDDVCLVMKTKFLTPAKDKPFEVDIKAVLEAAFKGRKNPPEVEIINEYIPDIGSLYTACDAVISMSSCEGFWLPGLEALACGPIIIAPRHGGQLDFLNDDNSLLVDTGEMIARRVYENLDEEKARVKEAAAATVEKFTWEAAAQMILDLPIPEMSRKLTKTRKVLYIVPYTMAGGGEVWIREAIRKLDRSLYEPHIAFVNGLTPELTELFQNEDVVIEDLSNRGRQFALKCLIESENYAIVHFYNSFGVYNILRNAWRQGYRNRIVETVHSELNWNDSMVKVAARDKMVSLIVSVSNTLAQKMVKLGNKNVALVQQQVNWDKFKIERHKGVLDELGIPKKFVVGFVGRLSPEKNVPIILRCARGMPDASFVIVGDGPQSIPLKQMAGSLKNVFFVGRRTDVEKFYAAFDVLMLPSKMEGMPLVILEAMAAGTPIVASDVGAITEVVKDGVSGFISKDPNDYLLFVTCLAKLRDEKVWQECSSNSKAITGALEAQGDGFNINNVYNMLFKEVKI
jgi:glycosyltransferase involved in cell wall biosynthesis